MSSKQAVIPRSASVKFNKLTTKLKIKNIQQKAHYVTQRNVIMERTQTDAPAMFCSWRLDPLVFTVIAWIRIIFPGSYFNHCG